MQLETFDFIQNQDEPEEWRLENCTFGKTNLIVGENATGKTRTLGMIHSLANLLSGSIDLKTSPAIFKAIFDDDGCQIKYNLTCRDKEVISEKLYEDGECLLDRGPDGKGKIWSTPLSDFVEVQPPLERLAVVTKRDAIQHPFLEKLYHWGESVHYYRFGTPMGQNRLAAFFENPPPGVPVKALDDFDFRNTQLTVVAFKRGLDSLGEEYKNKIINDMNALGYDLQDISLGSINMNVGTDLETLNGIQIKEANVNAPIFQDQISAGMFRALALSIRLNCYLLTPPSCVVIDDIGEGLDYRRSTELIALLIKKMEETNAQLIMSSNNRFVMNGVPLEFWSIIQRIPNGVTLLNYRNSKELFDRFELTGLNNFDFFSSNYINSQKK